MEFLKSNGIKLFQFGIEGYKVLLILLSLKLNCYCFYFFIFFKL